MHLGIREKVAAVLLAILLITLSVNSLLALRSQQQDILDETHRRRSEAARFMAQYLAYSVVSYDYHTIELLLQDLTRGSDIVYARVENNRGNIMAAAGTPPTDSLQTEAFSEEIRMQGELLGKLALNLSTERVISTLATRQREVLLGQLLAIVVVLLTGFAAISVIIIRPLSTITRVIKRNLAAGESRLERLSIHSADEFGELARGFNALGVRLDQAREKLESRIVSADLELQEANHRLEEQARDLRDLNHNLEVLTITDPLTGLYNRRHFDRLMENEVVHSIRNDETISIILLDIDNFRSINERFGHGGGDGVLRSVANVISARVRKSDVACRFGGDEFFLFCRRATIANALSIADDLQRALCDDVLSVRDQDLKIRVSIGVATIPGVHHVSSAEELFQCAEAALRHGKQHGGGRTIHFSMLERELRTASL